MIEFQWDPLKAVENAQKHGITIAEASTVFGDTLAISIFDPDHSTDEDRFITIGSSSKGIPLLVSYTEYGDIIRIISARKLTRTERKAYENEIKRRKA